MKRDYGEMKGVPDSVIDSLARVVFPELIAFYAAREDTGEQPPEPPEAPEAPKEEKDR